MHRQIQHEMREHSRRHRDCHQPPPPQEGRPEQQRPHQGHGQRVRPVNVIERKSGGNARRGGHALDAGEHEGPEQDVEDAHAHEKPPGRGLGHPGFEREPGCEMASIHPVYSESWFSLLRSSHASIGTGARNATSTKTANPVSPM